ncbi:MAG: flagellar assembly peptidoglycan hydrolase FlgJ [Woeseia sp.]
MSTAAVTDFGQFAALRRGAEQNDPAALREVAGQFEALFIQTMLKNMRDASLGDPMFGDSEQHEMYQGMLDQQLSVEMASGQGIGLADMLVRQLGGEVASAPTSQGDFRLPAARASGSAASLPMAQADVAASHTTGSVASLPTWSNPVDFAKDVWPHAERAAQRLNVVPEAILAQAALETGWGRHVMPRGDGASSLNLFGIKAGSSWQGSSVARPTMEYADGVAKREVARFRSYPDVAAAFDDYAGLIGEHPRYASVLDHGADTQGFARALQVSGYATDPAYADKIENVLESETMRDVLRGLKIGHAMPISDGTTERYRAVGQPMLP